jgi:hypothetical protein
MNTQSSPKKVLILFVVAYTAWIAIQAWRNRSSPLAAYTAVAAGRPAKPDRVVAYYFHGTARCSTCRMIQAYTEKALATGFRDDLTNGRLEFRQVNFQRSENRHFVQDYQLYTSSVVIARFRDGKKVEWENLTDVWVLSESKSAFVSYLQRHVRDHLGRV